MAQVVQTACVCGMQQVRKESGDIVAEKAGSRRQDNRIVREHQTGNRKQSYTSGRRRRIEWHLGKV